MRKLRAVLNRSSKGLGFAGAFVRVLSVSKDPVEREAVGKILRGIPVEVALGELMTETGSSGELLRFVATLSRYSSLEASRGAERLSSMFEKWTLLKERRAMERRVMAFRGLIVSVVAGIVVGMLATIAPLISEFQVSLGTAAPATSSFSPYEGALFLLPGAIYLGFFLSPERVYLNVAISLAAFAGVVYFMGPLVSFSLSP